MSDEDESLGITQRRVNASDAPPVETTGASSVFALAGKPGSNSTPPPSSTGKRSPRREEALAALTKHGAQSPAQVAERIGISSQNAYDLLARMLAAKMVVRLGSHGSYTYDIPDREGERTQAAAAEPAPPSGFKGWLQRKGEASAEGRAKTAKPTKPAKRRAPRETLVGGAAPALQQVARPIPSLSCALYNTGELVIEAFEKQPLRLNRNEVRELVDYLLHLDKALQPRPAA
jgi:hypothetical protein